MRYLPFLGLTAALGIWAQPPVSTQEIDSQRSVITIHVGKSGLLAAAAHEHWIDAPISSGSIDSGGAMPGVRFTVEAKRLLVRPEKDQAEVQANMQDKVLEVATYPEITFRSTRAERRDSVWRVTGDLKLHGVTRSLVFDVKQVNDSFTGNVRIKQTDFGIQPIRIGGGLVKVRDELEISFRVFAAAGR